MNTFAIIFALYSFSLFAFFGSYSVRRISPWTVNHSIDATVFTDDQRDDYTDQIKELRSSNYRPSTDQTDKLVYNYINNPKNCSKSGRIKYRKINPRTGRKRGNKLRRRIFAFDKSFMKAINSSPNLSSECLKKLTENYIKYKNKEKDPLDSKFCKKQNSKCDLVKLYQNEYKLNVETLIGLNSDDNSNGTVNVTVDCFRNPNRVIKDLGIENLLNEYKTINECIPSSENEIKLIETHLGNYSVKKTQKNEYEVTMNIDFKILKDEKDNIDSNAVSNMYKNVNECLQKSNPFMNDSSGRKMNLKVINTKEASKLPKNNRPKVNNIYIRDDSFERVNVKNYNQNMNCATIIHELLHLTGLHDEYEETSHGKYVHKETGEVIVSSYRKKTAPADEEKVNYTYTADYNHCRAIPEKPSIMDNQFTVFHNSVNKLPNNFHCSCGYKSSQIDEKNKCTDKMKELNEKQKQVFFYSSNLIQKVELADGLKVASNCSVQGRKTKFYPINDLSESENIKIYSNIKRSENILSYVHTRFDPYSNRGIAGEKAEFTMNCDCSGDNKRTCDVFEQNLKQMSSGEKEYIIDRCPGLMHEKVTKDKDSSDKLYEFRRGNIINRSPMLRNAHFEKIIFGNCESRASRYRECMKYSYVAHNESCPERPSYCSDESLWLDSVK